MLSSQNYEPDATRKSGGMCSDTCCDPNFWIKIVLEGATVLFAALFGGYYSPWKQAMHCEKEFGRLYFEPQCDLKVHYMCWTGSTVTYGVKHECTEYWKSARAQDERRRLLSISDYSVGAQYGGSLFRQLNSVNINDIGARDKETRNKWWEKNREAFDSGWRRS